MDQQHGLKLQKERAPILASVSLILPVVGMAIVNLRYLAFPAFVLPFLAAFPVSLVLGERLR